MATIPRLNQTCLPSSTEMYSNNKDLDATRLLQELMTKKMNRIKRMRAVSETSNTRAMAALKMYLRSHIPPIKRSEGRMQQKRIPAMPVAAIKSPAATGINVGVVPEPVKETIIQPNPVEAEPEVQGMTEEYKKKGSAEKPPLLPLENEDKMVQETTPADEIEEEEEEEIPECASPESRAGVEERRESKKEEQIKRLESNNNQESDPASSPTKDNTGLAEIRQSPEECRKPMLNLPPQEEHLLIPSANPPAEGAGNGNPKKAFDFCVEVKRIGDVAADLVVIDSQKSSQQSPLKGRNAEKHGGCPRPRRIELSSPYQTKQSPFAEIVDVGISEYLGNRSFDHGKASEKRSASVAAARHLNETSRHNLDSGLEASITISLKKPAAGAAKPLADSIIQISSSLESYDSSTEANTTLKAICSKKSIHHNLP